MIINEKQIMKLIELFEISLEDNLTPYGRDEAVELLKTIKNQQSEELKAIE